MNGKVRSIFLTSGVSHSKRVVASKLISRNKISNVGISVPVNSMQRNFGTSCTLCQYQKMKDTPTEAKTKILYDGECNICAIEIAGLKMLTRKKNDVEFVDITTSEFVPEKFSGVTYEQAMTEMHVIGSMGQVYTQGDAIREMYKVSGLGWLARLTETQAVKPFLDKLYMRFAEYRLRKALQRCDADGGSCSIKLHNLKKKLREQEARSKEQ